MSWEQYRAVNPLLQEMYEYNSRVRDRVVLGKKNRTTPFDEKKCKGPCEGTGVVPVKEDSTEEWHFAKCRECGGTGKKEEVSLPCEEDQRVPL